jgi:hypothetical protein
MSVRKFRKRAELRLNSELLLNLGQLPVRWGEFVIKFSRCFGRQKVCALTYSRQHHKSDPRHRAFQETSGLVPVSDQTLPSAPTAWRNTHGLEIHPRGDETPTLWRNTNWVARSSTARCPVTGKRRARFPCKEPEYKVDQSSCQSMTHDQRSTHVVFDSFGEASSLSRLVSGFQL